MSPDFDQHIDDYLLNKLTNPLRAEFEKAMKTNKALEKQVNLRSIEIKGIKRAGRDQLKNRLKKIHDQTQKTPPKQRRIWPYVSSIAAAIALLIVNGIYLFNPNNTNSESLFAQHYEPYALSISTRDTNTEQIARLNELYNNKNYKAALPLFNEILANDASNARMLLGAGICNLELNRFSYARNHFTTIIDKNDLRLQNMARWYMALSFLKENQYEEAITYLDQVLQNPNADKYEEAKTLKAALKN